MPLIYRKSVQQTFTTMAKIPVRIKKYLHPSRPLRPGDEPVPLTDISNRQLAELAARYPEEYAEAARARGVEPVERRPRSKVSAEAAEEDESKPLEVPKARAGRPSMQPRRGRAEAPQGPLNRGAKIPAPIPGDDDLDDDDAMLQHDGERAAAMGELESMFVKMTVPEAIGLITEAAAQGRQKVLVKLLAAEEGSPRPRKSVLRTFVEVGVKSTAAPAPVPVDAGDDEGDE